MCTLKQWLRHANGLQTKSDISCLLLAGKQLFADNTPVHCTVFPDGEHFLFFPPAYNLLPERSPLPLTLLNISISSSSSSGTVSDALLSSGSRRNLDPLLSCAEQRLELLVIDAIVSRSALAPSGEFSVLVCWSVPEEPPAAPSRWKKNPKPLLWWCHTAYTDKKNVLPWKKKMLLVIFLPACCCCCCVFAGNRHQLTHLTEPDFFLVGYKVKNCHVKTNSVKRNSR